MPAPSAGGIDVVGLPAADLAYTAMRASGNFMNVYSLTAGKDGVIYLRARYESARAGAGTLYFGADGPAKLWVNGREIAVYPNLTNPAGADKCKAAVTLVKGRNELVVALHTNQGNAWGVYASAALDPPRRERRARH